MSRRLKGKKKSGAADVKKAKKRPAHSGESVSLDFDGENPLLAQVQRGVKQLVDFSGGENLSNMRVAQLAVATYVGYRLLIYFLWTGDDEIKLNCVRHWDSSDRYYCSNTAYCVDVSPGQTKCRTYLDNIYITPNTSRAQVYNFAAFLLSLMTSAWRILFLLGVVAYFSWDSQWMEKLTSRVSEKRQSLSSRDLKKVLNTTAHKIQTQKARLSGRKRTDSEKREDSSGGSSDDSSSGGSDSDDSSSESSSSD